MADIIPFPNKANTEPVIYSDYWGENKSFFELLEAIAEMKNDRIDTENKLR